MTEISGLFSAFVEVSGHRVEVPLSKDLTPESCAAIWSAFRVLLGPGFGCEVLSKPPRLVLWKEPRKGPYEVK